VYRDLILAGGFAAGPCATRALLRTLREYEALRGERPPPSPEARFYADEWLEPEVVAAYETARTELMKHRLSVADRVLLANMAGGKKQQRMLARAFSAPGRRRAVRVVDGCPVADPIRP